MKEMQAVILCGGLGTRLRPLTAAIPKALVEVGGRPFLEHQFLELRRHSITRILLLTGYLGGMVEDRFGDGKDWGLALSYSREETPLGTGGALLRAAPRLEDAFFLINGDTFLPLDYGRLNREFVAGAGLGMISVVASAGTGRPPNVKLGEGRKVVDYRRRAPAAGGFAHVDAGVGVFSRRLVEHFPAGPAFALEETVYPRLARRGLLGGFFPGHDFFDIGTPERLAVFERYLHENVGGEVR